jgi:hypothetical protein
MTRLRRSAAVAVLLAAPACSSIIEVPVETPLQ